MMVISLIFKSWY